jgi:acetamidase/formamidase
MSMKWIAFAISAGAALMLQADDGLPTKELLRQVPAKNFPGRVHLLPATLDTVQWGWFDNAQAPVLTVRSGDTVVMETMMHSHNQIVPGVTIEEIRQLRLDHPGRGPHSVTGPVFVEGAEPGDILKVHINRIVPRAYGANFNIPSMFGEFPDKFPDGQVRYFYLDIKRMVTEFAPGIEVPLRPFPGTIGVARAESGKYSTVPPGRFGGNMDIRELVAGTTLYVPVFVPGALLWSGDSHAAQGNGEVNLTALETAFKELSLTVEVLKGASLEWPRIETPTHWITMGYDKDLNAAHEVLKSETIKFLAERRKIPPSRAQAVMHKTSDCRIAEVVNISKGVYCMNPKDMTVSAIPARPKKETLRYLVTWSEDADLGRAMDEASMSMIELLQAKKGMSRLDAYSLASMTMDCRLGDSSARIRRVHCLVPKSLWIANKH